MIIDRNFQNTFARGLRSFLLLTVLGLVLAASTAEAGLKIYYIRHAEGGHNVTEDWADVPKDQWPDYVGNPDIFTPKGLSQQAKVAEKLKKHHFDFIAASPLWRCRNTILPYLKEMDAKAEIWPELKELRASSLILSTDLPKPTEPILAAGKEIELPSNEAPWFSLREDGTKEFKVPRAGEGKEADERSSAAARVVIQRVLDMIRSRFGGTDKAILLSGHGSSGKAVLRMLTQVPLRDFPSISNTGIWMAEEQTNGEFKLMMYNDAPVENGKLTSASSSRLPGKFAPIDADKDGQVTKEEYVAYYAVGFERKDTNKDGVLSPDEHDHSSFEWADKNKDKQLTPEEHSAVYDRQFDNSYDKNRDGVITLDEM